MWRWTRARHTKDTRGWIFGCLLVTLVIGVWSWTYAWPPSNNPTNCQAVGPETFGSRKIKVTWIDNTNLEIGYTIERWNTARAIYMVLDTVATDEVIWYDTRIDYNKAYYYRVRAYDASTTSGYSNVGSNR